MSSDAASDGRLLAAVGTAVDALAYALAVTTAVVVASLTVGVATGGGFVRGKVLLFAAGWVVVGYALVLLWPTSPADLESARTGESMPARHDTTRFRSLVQRLPPLRWMPRPPPGRRLSIGSKLLLSGVLVLAVSFLMEAAFGVV